MREARPLDDPTPPFVRAFRALSNRSSALELLNRLEARFGRQFTRAFAEFNELRASGSSCPAPNIDEPTHQVIENTATDPGATRIFSQSGPIEPEPQHSTGSERQTVVDRPSANPPTKCILPDRAAAATQTP
jgi:hypothetical protein